MTVYTIVIEAISTTTKFNYSVYRIRSAIMQKFTIIW